MGITEDPADTQGNDQQIAQVAAQIGASSQTTQEAFMTAVRVRLEKKRAGEFLAEKLAKGPVDPSTVGRAVTGRILDPTADNPGVH